MHKILQQTTAKSAAGVSLEFCKDFESFQEASENIQFTHLISKSVSKNCCSV